MSPKPTRTRKPKLANTPSFLPFLPHPLLKPDMDSQARSEAGPSSLSVPPPVDEGSSPAALSPEREANKLKFELELEVSFDFLPSYPSSVSTSLCPSLTRVPRFFSSPRASPFLGMLSRSRSPRSLAHPPLDLLNSPPLLAGSLRSPGSPLVDAPSSLKPTLPPRTLQHRIPRFRTFPQLCALSRVLGEEGVCAVRDVSASRVPFVSVSVSFSRVWR